MKEDIIVSLENIVKSFAGVRVLDNVNFNLKKGEVHALVGENGAGKSTLMKILMGIISKDGGKVFVNGKEQFDYNVSIAKKNGITIIPQELSLIPDSSVAESVMLGQRPLNKLGFVDWNKMMAETEKIIKELGFDIDPKTKVRKLSIAHRQLVSIVKAIADNAKIIIMDEPTSSLSKEEVNKLFSIIDTLRKREFTIIYISHMLDEVFEVADIITVLRDGQNVGTKIKKHTSHLEIISLMLGRILLSVEELLCKKLKKDIDDNTIKGNPLLEVKSLKRKVGEPSVSFKLYSGEVLGITGLIGSGKTELVRSVFGLDKIEKGEIIINGEKIKIRNPREAFEAGMGFVPEDRRLQGLVLPMSVIENISLIEIYRKRISKFGFINKKKEKKDFFYYIENLNIQSTSSNQRVYKLSGGNQQKIVLSKVLLAEPKILILDEPTRGIDVGAKAAIYKLIIKLKEKGISVIFISSDISEMPIICDRVLIMRNKEIVCEITDRDGITPDKIMYSMAGGRIKNELRGK